MSIVEIRLDQRRGRYRIVAATHDREIYRVAYGIWMSLEPLDPMPSWPRRIWPRRITVGYLDAAGWRLAETPYSAAVAALPRCRDAIGRLTRSLVARVALAAGAPLPPPSRLETP